jgi:hypothetical protein
MEMNKFKITGLKHSQLTTVKLQKNFNALNEKPEKVPDWQTTGIIYLRPKLGDSEEFRNSRPITCLTTTYKALTGIIAKRISTHLEEHSLLTAEQKGCHSGSKQCKGQLVISKEIHEDCKRRNKNLSSA